MIFGDKPFEILLVRTPDNESETANDTSSDPQPKWRWEVITPLDAPEFNGVFAEMVLDCIQIEDESSVCAVTMTANQMSVENDNIEIQFAFSNAFVRRSNKRRLMHAFKRANKAWNAVRKAIAWAWDYGNLVDQLNKQVELIINTNPNLVNNLQLGVARISDDPKDVGIVDIPGVVTLVDKDCVVSRSPYGKAVLKGMKPVLQEMVKSEMIEYMNIRRHQLLHDIPSELMALLDDLNAKTTLMNQMGIPVRHDPTLLLLNGILYAHLERYELAKTFKPGMSSPPGPSKPTKPFLIN